MNVSLLSRTTWTLAALAGLPLARAGEPISNPNRITIGPRAAFSVKAAFSSGIGASGVNPGPATGGGLARTYDDGFIGVDSSGNEGGRTWYWGYQADSQVNLTAGSLTMNALVGDDTAGLAEADEDFLMGGEVAYTRYFFEFGRANWGLELGAGFTPVSIDDDSTLAASASAIRDVFSLGGVVPPKAPYTGSYGGPGAVIDDSPTRTTVSRDVSIAGEREIESSTFGLRIGPSLDIPMGDPLSLQISGGAYILYADSEFTWNETVSVGGQVLRGQSGKVSEEDWLVGAYVRGQFLVMLSRTVGIYAGGEYLMLDDLEIGDGTHTATLDFGGSFAAFLGVAFSF